MAIKREVGESTVKEYFSALKEEERFKPEFRDEFSEPEMEEGGRLVKVSSRVRPPEEKPSFELVELEDEFRATATWRGKEAVPTRPKLEVRITQLDRQIGSLQHEVGLQVKQLQDLTVQVAWLEIGQRSLARQVTDFIRKVKQDISVTQVAKASLYTSKQGIAVLSSFGIATLVGLAVLLYGAFESIWAATGGGLGLLALVLYEVLRLSKSKE